MTGAINRSMKKAAVLGLAATALCFAWGVWAQDPADLDDPIDLEDPADSTDLADAEDPADSTDLADADDPADSTDLADLDDPEDPTGTETAPVISITKQPAAAVTVMLGAIADTLTVEAEAAEGTTLAYQWYEIRYSVIDENIVPYEDIAIDGATSASFVIPVDLDTGTYSYYCVVSAADGEAAVRSDVATVTVADPTSVASANREIPSSNPGKIAVISPAAALSAEFAAGPNPVAKRSGGVTFFRSGAAAANGTLYVYDASGNFVRKIAVSGGSDGAFGKRAVGSWDLRDSKGRSVPEGSYAVKGAFLTKAGVKEKVSLILGVK